MENVVIIVIIAVIAAFGVRATARHFKGQGGCCGGGGYRPRKKKLARVVGRKTFRVEGMHCANCKRRVEEIVNDMKGLSGKVDLKKGELTVSYSEGSENVADELIMERMERAGYTLCREKEFPLSGEGH